MKAQAACGIHIVVIKHRNLSMSVFTARMNITNKTL